jgi:hypothetical protein
MFFPGQILPAPCPLFRRLQFPYWDKVLPQFGADFVNRGNDERSIRNLIPKPSALSGRICLVGSVLPYSVYKIGKSKSFAISHLSQKGSEKRLGKVVYSYINSFTVSWTRKHNELQPFPVSVTDKFTLITFPS